jgi:hypothetical protein
MEELIKARQAVVVKKEEAKVEREKSRFKQCTDEAIQLIKTTFNEKYITESHQGVNSEGMFRVQFIISLPMGIPHDRLADELYRELRAVSLTLGWNKDNPHINWSRGFETVCVTATYTIPKSE